MELASLQAALGEKAIAGELMSRHTTFGIGGPADLFVVAHTLPELCTAVRLAFEHDVPCFILGSGANLLVADKGIRGLVIHNECAGIVTTPDGDGQTSPAQPLAGRDVSPSRGRENTVAASRSQEGPESAGAGSAWLVQAESGALLQAVARHAMAKGLAGLEWAVDVPGTVGGAVVGNAGAFGGYVSDNLRRALILTPSEAKPGSTESPGRWWSKDELKLGYRTSSLKENSKRVRSPPVILQAVFALHKEDPVVLKDRAEEYMRRRLETQPLGPSAGSVFKRTAQYPAGFLIENAGLKDTRIGGAVISPQHANFIINVGRATAQDVRELIELVREKVYAQFKIMLELEVELVGDW
jgi:UDP-N-acetylmuramate dehydrogenase